MKPARVSVYGVTQRTNDIKIKGIVTNHACPHSNKNEFPSLASNTEVVVETMHTGHVKSC